MDMINKTKALRSEAWQAVLDSPVYRAFKGLDDAVKAMSGEESALLVAGGGSAQQRHNVIPKSLPVVRITQGDIAARVLKSNGEPLPVGRWLEKSIADGINIKGDDPLSNFRSTVSRDKRFYSIKRNNMYFWWFNGVGLPDSWKAATDPDLLGLSAAANSSDQEGGEGHEATMS